MKMDGLESNSQAKFTRRELLGLRILAKAQREIAKYKLLSFLLREYKVRQQREEYLAKLPEEVKNYMWGELFGAHLVESHAQSDSIGKYAEITEKGIRAHHRLEKQRRRHYERKGAR